MSHVTCNHNTFSGENRVCEASGGFMEKVCCVQCPRSVIPEENGSSSPSVHEESMGSNRALGDTPEMSTVMGEMALSSARTQ